MKGQFLTITVILMIILAAVKTSARESVLAGQLLENYDVEVPPDDEVIDVEVGVYVRNFEYISCNDRKYKMQLLLRTKWFDSRLEHDSQFDSITVSADKIWIPDLYIANELLTVEQRSMQGSQMARVKRDGEVRLERRFSVEMTCPMDLHSYPFDIQRCPLILTSWIMPKSQLQMKWAATPLRLSKHVRETNDFQLEAFETQNCSFSTVTDVFSCLRGEFILERMVSPYLVRVFVPISVCVFISYFTYWINCSPVRVTILMFDLLAAMFICHSATSISPITEYTTHLDIFTGLSLSFIVFAIFEFVIVHNIYKRELMNEKIHSMMNDIRSNWVDCICRLLVPLFFATFVFLYFALTLLGRS